MYTPLYVHWKSKRWYQFTDRVDSSSLSRPLPVFQRYWRVTKNLFWLYAVCIGQLTKTYLQLGVKWASIIEFWAIKGHIIIHPTLEAVHWFMFVHAPSDPPCNSNYLLNWWDYDSNYVTFMLIQTDFKLTIWSESWEMGPYAIFRQCSSR